MEFVPGATPKAFFLDADGQPDGAPVELRGDLKAEGVLRLLAERGFEARLAPVDFGTPRSTVTLGDARFELYEKEANFDTASEFAAGRRDEDGRPGRLLTIGSAEENEQVRGWLRKVHNRGAVWLGCTDADEEGRWRWQVDSNPHFYTAAVLSTRSDNQGHAPAVTQSGFFANWADKEPNNAGSGDGEDCATFLVTGEWNDESCGGKHRVVVKFGPDAKPADDGSSHDEL